ncbi:MAG: GNAT family N-acetyltransferase [Chloroflexota bacterium]
MTPSEITVRPAAAADNEAMIALELQSALDMGEAEQLFDRSPDAFACCRVQDSCRILVAELDRCVAAMMAGVMIRPIVQGHVRTLVYIHRARVHPDFQHRGAAMALSSDLFAWAGRQGGEGPCYAIAPANAPSLSFVERGGGRWPLDVCLVDIETDQAVPGEAQPILDEHLPEVVRVVNDAHAGEDFFEPLTLESLKARLNRDESYSLASMRGVFANGRLVAVGGLLDKGAYTRQIRIDRSTGEETWTRGAAIVDWGIAPGHEDASAEVLTSLGAEARSLGRSTVTICEPHHDAVSMVLPHRRLGLSLFTPSLKPPPASRISGLYLDLLNL